MAHLSTAFCRQLARARREKGMTQSALAQAVSCKQSAISMLESGQPSKLSQETVERIAALLEVPMGDPSPADTPSPQSHAGYCPNADCFSNIPYVVSGELFFWPAPLRPSSADDKHCAYCGELLERQCPECGAAFTAGGCCPSCGSGRVANTLPAEINAPEWAANRRREIAEWRSLLPPPR